MSDLVEFLRARLDADEREAIDVKATIAKRTHYRAGVTARADRDLREVEAKRRIIDEHPQTKGWDGRNVNAAICRTCGTADSYGGLGGDPYPCATLRLLALPYARHKDYREEWKL